ncbi:hypothetical protein BDD12DRAFT_526557 [Trichophaea hybrida]|nr:hypothetical protein BDD12DRAFT_526557 [Trichophaea hybrida]
MDGPIPECTKVQLVMYPSCIRIPDIYQWTRVNPVVEMSGLPKKRMPGLLVFYWIDLIWGINDAKMWTLGSCSTSMAISPVELGGCCDSRTNPEFLRRNDQERLGRTDRIFHLNY